jgi:hypothetical protein
MFNFENKFETLCKVYPPFQIFMIKELKGNANICK